jgi:hypothetical protein
MKRDLDLIRRILLATEEAPDFSLSCSDLASEDQPVATIARHVRLVEEAGYLEANLLDLEGHGVLDGTISRLTWSGHEFLEAARDNTTWQKAKRAVADKAGGTPLEVIKALLISYASARLGLSGPS